MRKVKIIDTNQISDIINLYKSGNSSTDIGIKYNVSPATITRILKNNNINVSISNFSPPNKNKNDEIICSLYKKGENIKYISQYLSLSEKWVSKILKKHNLIGDLRLKLNIEMQKILSLYNEHQNGASVSELAIRENISISWLKKLFIKHNLPIIHRVYNKILGKTKINIETIDLMVKLYNERKSITDISKTTNVCVSQVWRMLQKRGIKTEERGLFDYREKIRIYPINENYFDEINTPEKAYILGFLYADGNAHKKHAHITLKLQDRDKHILDQINVLIDCCKPLHFAQKQSPNHMDTYTLKITNKVIYNNLIKFGVVPNKTFVLNFPSFLSSSLIPHFIRGYFDGDGCISFEQKSKAASWDIIGTTSLCSSVQQILLETLNVKSYLSHDKRCAQGIDKLRVRAFSDIIKIFEWLYNDSTIHLHRKYNKFIEIFNIKNAFI